MARILIVDDEPSICSLLEDIAKLDGHEAKSYGTAEDLLADLDQAGGDLVLLDFYLPGLRGWEAVRRIHEARPDLPVIAVTAAGGVSLERSSEEGLGFAGFVRKPFRIEELRRKMTAALEA